MIFKEEGDGRERVTEDEERVSIIRRINRDQISDIARLSSSKNFRPARERILYSIR